MSSTRGAGWILLVTMACAALVRFSLLRFPRLWYDEATSSSRSASDPTRGNATHLNSVL